MTNKRRDGKQQTPFSMWCRANPQLDSLQCCLATQDIDWIWHQYKVKTDRVGTREINHILLIEEKSFGADLTISERDVMFQLDQILSRTNTERVMTVRKQWIDVRFWGYFKLRYSGATLPASDTVWWNKTIITLKQLEQILRFEINPRTFAARDDRRHHTPRPLPLFDGSGSP